MPEQNGNIDEAAHGLGPKYAIRIADLTDRHIVRACCGACPHTAVVTRWRLLTYRTVWGRLIELEPRLRCTHCRHRGTNVFRIRLRVRLVE